MNRRGRPISSPFPQPQHGNSSRLYAVEFRDGCVKVGFTQNPVIRMQKLQATRRCKLVRWTFTGLLELRLGQRLEKQVLNRAARISATERGTNEFFSGLKFGEATNLLRQVVKAASKAA